MKLPNLSKENLLRTIPILIDAINAEPGFRFDLEFSWDETEARIVIRPTKDNLDPQE